MRGWTTTPLAEVADVQYGTRVVRKKDGGSLYPVYGGGGATFKVDAYNRENCFIVSRFGISAECVRYVRDRFFLNDSGLTVSTKSDQLLQAFLDRQLLARQAEIYELSRGTAQRNLDVTRFRDLPLSYPTSLDEQRRIVAALDEAFAAIATATANAERNLANARELMKAEVQAIFQAGGEGWSERRLPDISDNWDSRRRPVTKKDRIPGDIPYYGASGQVDSVREYLFDDDLLLVSEDGANLLMRTYPIAFSIAGKSWVNNHAHILKFSHAPTQRLVEYYLNSISLEPWVSGMAQPKLNQKALNEIPIPLPLDGNRERIAQRLDLLAVECEALVDCQQAILSELSLLKQVLLVSAFDGSLFKESQPLAA